MASTYSQTPAARQQLIAHFRENGKPHESHGMEPCETILEIESDGVCYAMETWDVVQGDLPPSAFSFFIGADEVEACEIYERLLQI